MGYPGKIGLVLTVCVTLAMLSVAITGCPPPQEPGMEDLSPNEEIVWPEPDPPVEPEERRVPDEEVPDDAVEVILTEMAIDMPDEIPAGATVFHVINEGSLPHNVQIEGEDVDVKLDEDLQAGESDLLFADLAPGEYRAWCPVGAHEDQGMVTNFTVVEE